MADRIKIRCPACSARLAAPTSAVGRTLLCPKCRTGIPVQKSTTCGITSIDKQANADGRQNNSSKKGTSSARNRIPSNSQKLFVLLTAGASLVLLTAFCIRRVSEANRNAHRAETIVKALNEENYDLVLSLEPNHVEALVGRVRQRLRLPGANINGANEDLAQLRQHAPDHSIHKEIRPALLTAEAVEHARAGKVAAAIHTLGRAREIGCKEPQLTVVKQTLIPIVLLQAETHLRNERFAEAITTCNTVLELGGNPGQIKSILQMASEAAAERAKTPEDVDNAIAALETLLGMENSIFVTKTLYAMHLKRSRMARSAGFLDVAKEHFSKLLTLGHKDVEVDQFAIELAESMIANYSASPSDRNRNRAMEFVSPLEKIPIDLESIISIRLQLSTAVFTGHKSTDRDRTIDFSTQSLTLARSHGIDLEPHRRLISLLAQAHADRCITRLQKGDIQVGVDDFVAAIELCPLQRLTLLHRFEQAGIPIPDQLTQELMKSTPAVEGDSMWSVIPANAEAFMVVRNIESFSDKLDGSAHQLKVRRPAILNTVLKRSAIGDGLRRDGNLGWIQLPIKQDGLRDDGGVVYVVPTTNFVSMIQPIRLKDSIEERIAEIRLYPVKVNMLNGYIATRNSYGLFAYEEDKNSLVSTLQSPHNISIQIQQCDDWGADLDAYVLITEQGLLKGIRDFRVPYSIPIVEEVFSDLRRSFPVFSLKDGGRSFKPPVELLQVAIGITIQPEIGIAVRSRAWTKPATDLDALLSDSLGGRERSLKLLPDAPFLAAIGGPVSAGQCEVLSSLAALMFPGQQKPDVNLSHLQIGLLKPELPPMAAEVADQETSIAALARLQRSMVVVVEVPGALSSLDDLEDRFKAHARAMAGPAAAVVPPTERVEADGIPVLRVRPIVEPNVAPLLDPSVMSIAAPNGQTLVITFGDDAQLTQALITSRGGASMAESATVKAAVKLLPESSSWVFVVDFREILSETFRRFEKEKFMGVEMGDEIRKKLGITDGRPLPVAIGMSWEHTALDINLCIPNETLSSVRGILKSLPFVVAPFQQQ